MSPIPSKPEALVQQGLARVAALKALAILDTPREEVYDVLTRLAASVCSTPIALVSLIDGERLWFKAAFGLDAAGTSSASSFCSEAANRNELLEVCDASEDQRFCSIGLVAGELGVRFYAGVPLVVVGVAVGTLCVLDRQPQRLTEKQREALQDLARLTVLMLQARMEAFRLLSLAKSV